MFQPKCKVCKSGVSESVEFCRFYLEWSYETIIDVFCDDIDNLNEYNLSNHFNVHADRETIKFWRSLRNSIGIYEPSAQEEQALYERIKQCLQNGEA